MQKGNMPFVAVVSSDSLHELQNFINGEIEGRLSVDGSLRFASMSFSTFVDANGNNWYMAMLLFEPKNTYDAKEK